MFSSIGNAAGGVLPVFQEEPACAQYCPKLTFQQVIRAQQNDFNDHLVEISVFEIAANYWLCHLLRRGLVDVVHGNLDVDWRTFNEKYPNFYYSLRFWKRKLIESLTSSPLRW